jgi:predicted TIM-barrel fold metal-dependent hydrolase
MVVDAHCHSGEFAGFISGSHPPSELVSRWDSAGVDAGVMSVLDGYDVSGANDNTREACEQYQGRIYGYIYLNPTNVNGSLAELERCSKVECFRGVKLHPSNDTYYPFFEGYFPVYERIEQLGFPILWHSGTSPYSHPLQIAYVARLFPDVPFILAHFALSDLSWECFPAAELAANVYVDITANPIIPVLNDWIERFGGERMLWGSDFPFYDVAYELAKVDFLGCSQAQKQQISSENARRLFRL